MTASPGTKDRGAVIETAEKEVRRWSRYVDTLLSAFGGRDETPPSLHAKMEALRNKRDRAVTKVAALRLHRSTGWARAWKDLVEARRELRDSWRSVISTLDKESLFV